MNTRRKVTPDNISLVAEHCKIEFMTDASDIGLAPGEWPRMLETTLGNGRPFIFIKRGERGAALYAQELGCITLVVFND